MSASEAGKKGAATRWGSPEAETDDAPDMEQIAKAMYRKAGKGDTSAATWVQNYERTLVGASVNDDILRTLGAKGRSVLRPLLRHDWEGAAKVLRQVMGGAEQGAHEEGDAAGSAEPSAGAT